MAEAFTTENPSNKILGEPLRDYRQQLEDFLLDAETPIYDRLHTFFATQEGNWREYRNVPVIHHLQKAESQPVLVKGIGQRAVGFINPDYPWSVIDTNSDLGLGIEHPRALSLAANFLDLRLISSDASYLHESYGQTSTRPQTGPVVTRSESTQVTIDIGEEPVGSEHFIVRLNNIIPAVVVGVEAIHESFQSDQAINQDPATLVALHAATSIALAQIS